LAAFLSACPLDIAGEAAHHVFLPATVSTVCRGLAMHERGAWAPHGYYFADPDGNVVEARYYE
jgi:hypothetical protein